MGLQEGLLIHTWFRVFIFWLPAVTSNSFYPHLLLKLTFNAKLEANTEDISHMSLYYSFSFTSAASLQTGTWSLPGSLAIYSSDQDASSTVYWSPVKYAFTTPRDYNIFSMFSKHLHTLWVDHVHWAGMPFHTTWKRMPTWDFFYIYLLSHLRYMVWYSLNLPFSCHYLSL